MSKCECCGQEIPAPRLSAEEYERRAIPRLKALDILSKKINFHSLTWRDTPEGERWQRLMDEQARDEHAAGL